MVLGVLGGPGWTGVSSLPCRKTSSHPAGGKANNPKLVLGITVQLPGVLVRVGRFIAVCAEAGLKEEGVPYPPHQGLLSSPAGGSWQLAMKNQLLFLFLLSADLTQEISLLAA